MYAFSVPHAQLMHSAVGSTLSVHCCFSLLFLSLYVFKHSKSGPTYPLFVVSCLTVFAPCPLPLFLFIPYRAAECAEWSVSTVYLPPMVKQTLYILSPNVDHFPLCIPASRKGPHQGGFRPSAGSSSCSTSTASKEYRLGERSKNSGSPLPLPAVPYPNSHKT
jgi:hypothetical protein